LTSWVSSVAAWAISWVRTCAMVKPRIW
jgi:hypothetical protein